MSAIVKVNFKKIEVMARYKVAELKAKSIYKQQILKDSNFFAPNDTSELIRSSIRYVVSHPFNDYIIWDTPYAKYQYYGLSHSGKPLNYSKDVNPNARSHWFEYAKVWHEERWIDIFGNALERGMK